MKGAPGGGGAGGSEEAEEETWAELDNYEHLVEEKGKVLVDSCNHGAPESGPLPLRPHLPRVLVASPPPLPPFSRLRRPTRAPAAKRPAQQLRQGVPAGVGARQAR